ncbi:hypothetical protein [Guptibacillus hwajinpoensis]|uniref:Lipoprotein n=1 Tax=Guptibacillus hwajinpoensis TaxID=208199 RepID=A0ABU0K4K4_9BACL|nr:hypothetical protein [Alkalihalobacillus hemicentroti]MDQ0484279.1 hypothetical protein [Alkalihalobacillus hemicentroti]
MFKKVTLGGIALSLAFTLTACGSNVTNDVSGSTDSQEEATAADQKEVSNKEEKDESIPEPKKDENGNIILDTVGQKVEDESATAELMKIKEVNETLSIAPLEVTIKDIKLIKLTDINEELMMNLEMYGAKGTPEELSYIQVKYIAENTEEKNIEWYDLMNVVTDKGEQIDAQMNDFITDDSDMDSQFLGKVKKEFTDGFIVKDEDISKVKLIFGYTMDSDSYEDITDEQQVEYTF